MLLEDSETNYFQALTQGLQVISLWQWTAPHKKELKF